MSFTSSRLIVSLSGSLHTPHIASLKRLCLRTDCKVRIYPVSFSPTFSPILTPPSSPSLSLDNSLNRKASHSHASSLSPTHTLAQAFRFHPNPLYNCACEAAAWRGYEWRREAHTSGGPRRGAATARHAGSPPANTPQLRRNEARGVANESHLLLCFQGHPTLPCILQA